MTDRSKAVQDITPVSAYSVGPDLIILQDVSANQTTVITVANFFGNSQANIVVSHANLHIAASNFKNLKYTTPVTSSDTIEKGMFWFDADYMYVAVANNTIKRVGLNTF